MTKEELLRLLQSPEVGERLREILQPSVHPCPVPWATPPCPYPHYSPPAEPWDPRWYYNEVWC